MRIGQLAEKTHVSASRIRFYERHKLLPRPVRLANGYRDYDTRSVERVMTIVTCQELGFSLAEIRAALPSSLDDMMDGAVAIENLNRKLDEVETRIRKLRTQEKKLREKLEEELSYV